MKPRTSVWAVLFVLAAFAAQPASATVIEYEATNIAGSEWRYDYSVTNDGVDPIDEFTIFFELGLFENLLVAASPAGWDSIVVQPDPLLEDDGFFDALALDGPLAPGGSVLGFSVTFNWLGAGAPGAQPWDVVDPLTIETLQSGRTVPRARPTEVPEPGSLALLGLGLLSLGVTLRRKIA